VNTPKKHRNDTVKTFLSGYLHVGELCREFPQLDDMFSGVLELKTAGNTSTRALSRQVLFHILQWCPVIDVDSINEATNQHYAYSTVAGYAALARVASKAVEGFIAGRPQGAGMITVRQAQEALDQPFMAELSALGLM
jgi:hypothetical protein